MTPTMNYYPYQAYQAYQPYSQYSQYSQPSQYQQYPPQAPYQAPPVQNSINCKVVESGDIVKTIEIPIGSYGVFPKADGTAIYTKSWNTDGTTKIISYSPTGETEDKKDVFAELDALKHSISDMSKKIDVLANSKRHNGGRNDGQ